jgi:fermentation-respiration switch protein FrsA (DUF1100 family)
MNQPPDNARRGLLASPWVRSLLYLVGGYVGLVAMLLFLENLLVYRPSSAADWLAPPEDSGIEDVYVTSSDSTRIHGWWCPDTTSDVALLYCHGNAGNVSHRGGSIVKLRKELACSVLIIDYPGFGKSEGKPTEPGCYAAADAAYQWLVDEKKCAPKKIVLYGASLGGGVITDLASRKDHRALVLIKTFTSMPAVASDIYWWLPAPTRLLMTNQFDSLSKIGGIHRPVFIAHGTADSLIPYAHGKRLFEAANEPKFFFEMPGADHNHGLPPAMFDLLRTFLRENPVD